MKKVLILGNGISRKKLKEKILNWKHEIWVCNWGFKEATTFHINRVYTVHKEVLPEASKFRNNYNLDYLIVSKKGLDDKIVDRYFQKSLGWSTGNLAIVDAIEEKYDKIYLVGFDFGGWDIYQPHKLVGSNFEKQFKQINRIYHPENIFLITENGERNSSEIFSNENLKDDKPSEQKEISELKNLNKHASYLIIGNSPEVLQYKLGSFINNNFDYVVRLNDFETKNYEEFIGNRTSFWFTGASKFCLKKNRDISNTQPVLAFTAGRGRLFDSDKGRAQLKEDVQKSLEIPFERCKYITKQVSLDIQKKYNMTNPSTGFLTLYYFIEYLGIPKIIIHGFDFFQERYHYYDENQEMKTNISTAHDFDKEREIINGLIEKKRIRTLFDYNKNYNKLVKNIFVFGNSPEINKIDFDKIRELKQTKNFVTAGVNRIFYKYQPDYFFFMDGAILEELQEKNIQRESHSQWVVPSFLFDNPEYPIKKDKFQEYIDKQNILEIDVDFYGAIKRKSSILWLLYYLQNIVFKNQQSNFYLHGISLVASDKINYFDGTSHKLYSQQLLEKQYTSQLLGLKDFQEKNNNLYSFVKSPKIKNHIPLINDSIEQFIENKIYDRSKKAIVSMMTPEFLVAYPVFVRSLLKFNPWYDLPIILLVNGLSKNQKEFCTSYYPKTIFKDIKTHNYNKINFSSTRASLQKTYYKLDIFSLTELDTVIFLDLDIVIQGDISELFNRDEDILLTTAYTAGRDALLTEMNSGVIVINKTYLNDTTYKGTISLAENGYSLPDQAVINEYFKGRITELPKKYNCEKRLLKSHKHKHLLNDAVIIHYVSQKPWDTNKTEFNQGFEQLENIWWSFVDNKEDVEKWKKLV